MVWSLWRCAATVVFLASLSVPVRAAEMGCASFYGNTPVPEDRAKNLWPSGVRPTADTCKAAFIQGDIVEGDYQKFLSLYRKNHPFMEHVSLKSPGGTVDDAMEIGRLFRKYLIAVELPLAGGRRRTISDDELQDRIVRRSKLSLRKFLRAHLVRCTRENWGYWITSSPH